MTYKDLEIYTNSDSEISDYEFDHSNEIVSMICIDIVICEFKMLGDLNFCVCYSFKDKMIKVIHNNKAELPMSIAYQCGISFIHLSEFIERSIKSTTKNDIEKNLHYVHHYFHEFKKQYYRNYNDYCKDTISDFSKLFQELNKEIVNP